MRSLPFSTLVLVLWLAACGSTSAPDTSADASGDSAMCTGTPPLTCDGCCGSKYAADQCLNGAWTCLPLGGACAVCDAGKDSAADDASNDSAPNDASGESATCTGTAPLCFGNNSTLCCGNDPGGVAVCIGGAWMCGSALAPGCNGRSVIDCLRDAGPG